MKNLVSSILVSTLFITALNAQEAQTIDGEAAEAMFNLLMDKGDKTTDQEKWALRDDVIGTADAELAKIIGHGRNADGSVRFFPVATDVEEVKKATAKISVYPHPVEEGSAITVVSTNEEKPVKIVVRDLSGKEIQETPFKSENQSTDAHSMKMQLDNVAAGNYLLEVVNGENNSETLNLTVVE